MTDEKSTDFGKLEKAIEKSRVKGDGVHLTYSDICSNVVVDRVLEKIAEFKKSMEYYLSSWPDTDEDVKECVLKIRHRILGA